MKIKHSVTLNKEKCRGCTNCLKRCPTEAIRVRNGKAMIISERCVDCGECIRACPYHAKQAVCDSFDELENYKYRIALPAPSLYGQFSKFYDINAILTALKHIGFDDVVEVAWAAQNISRLSKIMLEDPNFEGKIKKPVISTACPAVVRLIRIRFPDLMDNLLNIMTPVELAAYWARRNAVETKGLKEDEIGIFFISPCPAKITSAYYPIGRSKPLIDKVLSMSEVYGRIRKVIGKIKEPEDLSRSDFSGIGWASSGGEADALNEELYIAIDGINNVIKVLEDLEDGKLDHVKFIELNACVGGCVGGCLTVENPYVTKSRIKLLKKGVEKNNERLSYKYKDNTINVNIDDVVWDDKEASSPEKNLSCDNRAEQIKKFGMVEEILKTLPGLDCGSCGAPSCRALAEDIVNGEAQEGDCVFILKDKMKDLFEEITILQQYMPPPFRSEQKKGKKPKKSK